MSAAPIIPTPHGVDRLCIKCGVVSRVTCSQGCQHCGASVFAMRPLTRRGEAAVLERRA